MSKILINFLPNSWGSTHFEAIAPTRDKAAPRNISKGGTKIIQQNDHQFFTVYRKLIKNNFSKFNIMFDITIKDLYKILFV